MAAVVVLHATRPGHRADRILEMLGHRLHRAGPIKVDPVSFRGEIHFLDIDEPEALELVKQGLADADPDWQQFIFLTEPH